MADTPDELSQLLEASFRNVPFPTAGLEVSFSHDGPEHRIFGKDVNNVENTGRNSRVWSAQIPFFNGVRAGRAEHQLLGKVLFPVLYRQFLEAMKDGSAGELVDPDTGPVNVKPRTCRARIDPLRRDGFFVDATWIESDDSVDGTAPALDSPSPVTVLDIESKNLDTLIGTMNPPPPVADGDPPFGSFAGLFTSLRSVLDTVELQQQRIAGVINNFSSELDRLKESVDRLNDCALWPVYESIEHLQSSLTDLAQAGQASRPSLRFYTVPRDTTLAGVAAVLRTDTATLARVNPLLLEDPVVRGGTVVAYANPQAS